MAKRKGRLQQIVQALPTLRRRYLLHNPAFFRWKSLFHFDTTLQKFEVSCANPTKTIAHDFLLRTMKNNVERIYFFTSFGFLILRTVYVSLYGAWIHDESRKPIDVLNSVPASIYNLEVRENYPNTSNKFLSFNCFQIRRFVQQVSLDTVALTGRNFFSVTRGLILSVFKWIQQQTTWNCFVFLFFR